MGLRSWVVKVESSKSDIEETLKQAKEGDNYISGIVFWAKGYYILFDGDGSSRKCFGKRDVYLLDNIPHEDNGKIKGAIYYGEEKFPYLPLQLTAEEIRKIFTDYNNSLNCDF